jgi:hypothetical protein
MHTGETILLAHNCTACKQNRMTANVRLDPVVAEPRWEQIFEKLDDRISNLSWTPANRTHLGNSSTGQLCPALVPNQAVRRGMRAHEKKELFHAGVAENQNAMLGSNIRCRKAESHQ